MSGSDCILSDPLSPDHRNAVTIRGALADGRQLSVGGTLTGPKHVEKVVEIDGYDLDLQPAEHMAFFRYHDRPGVVGELGRILGEHGVNIAGMQVSRDEQGGHALIAMTVDSPIDPTALGEIIAAIGAQEGCALDLDNLT